MRVSPAFVYVKDSTQEISIKVSDLSVKAPPKVVFVRWDKDSSTFKEYRDIKGCTFLKKIYNSEFKTFMLKLKLSNSLQSGIYGVQIIPEGGEIRGAIVVPLIYYSKKSSDLQKQILPPKIKFGCDSKILLKYRKVSCTLSFKNSGDTIENLGFSLNHRFLGKETEIDSSTLFTLFPSQHKVYYFSVDPQTGINKVKLLYYVYDKNGYKLFKFNKELLIVYLPWYLGLIFLFVMVILMWRGKRLISVLAKTPIVLRNSTERKNAVRKSRSVKKASLKRVRSSLKVKRFSKRMK